MASVRETMRKKLEAAFNPAELDLRDDSHHHAGHSGARPEGETHFTVHIVAEAFNSASRLERHRMVNKALSEELAGPVHALAIKAYAPGEHG
ncbi:MAG: BolA family protein [Hyphomicrobiales bacterium]